MQQSHFSSFPISFFDWKTLQTYTQTKVMAEKVFQQQMMSSSCRQFISIHLAFKNANKVGVTVGK